jgi:hypothetical protein
LGFSYAVVTGFSVYWPRSVHRGAVIPSFTDRLVAFAATCSIVRNR